MSVTELKTKAEFDEFIKEGKVIIDFTATWCGPCKAIKPKFEGWAKEYEGIKFGKVDVDENGDTAEFCEISAMPTFKCYHNGAAAGNVTGASVDKIKKLLDELKDK